MSPIAGSPIVGEGDSSCLRGTSLQDVQPVSLTAPLGVRPTSAWRGHLGAGDGELNVESPLSEVASRGLSGCPEV